MRPLGDTSVQADALDHLGAVHADLELAKAELCWRRAIAIYREQGRSADVDRIAMQLEAIRDRTPGPFDRQEHAVDVGDSERSG